MAPAFLLSSMKPVSLTNSFVGTSISTSTAPLMRTGRHSPITMEAYSLDKYTEMSATPPSPPLKPSTPSRQWVAYLNSVKSSKFNPFRGEKPKPFQQYSISALSVASTPFFLIEGKRSSMTKFKYDPDVVITRRDYMIAADKYMAQCISNQYKVTAAPMGTYNVQCTEATIRGQAEYARNLSLSCSYRMKHRSVLQKFADYTETRRKAIIGAHGCSYEEKLVRQFPISARSYVRAGAEAKSVCSRYANGTSVAEKYMAASVERQNMLRMARTGEYGVTCSDGNAKGVSEYKRVQALAAKFRAAQQPVLVKERVKFDSAKYARDYYGHLCSYEEKLFNAYPAVAASMRPNSSY